MCETRDEFLLAALALCLGCETFETNNIVTAESTTGDASSVASSSMSSATGGSVSSGGAGASSSSGDTSASSAGTGTTASSGGTSTSTTAPTTTAGADTAGQTSPNATHACLEYVLGFCEFSARCSGGLDGVIPCFEANSDSCPDLLFAPGSTRTVDATFECADAWRALACELRTPACATSGTRADGDACVSGIQCASRLCSGNAESCGSCLPSAELGEACDDAVGPQCKPGLQCHGADLVCVSTTEPIVGSLDLGEECDPARSDCYPNVCHTDDAGTYRCERYPTLGEDCSELLTCAYGDSYCDITHVCLALPAVGEFCGIDSLSASAQWCAEGLVCDQTFLPPICLAAPAAPGIGESCDGACQAGLSCRCADDLCSSRVCQWARLDGESCASPDEVCLMGECSAGTCVVTEVESTFEERCQQ